MRIGFFEDRSLDGVSIRSAVGIVGPELDREANLDRFRYYESSYAKYMSQEERAKAPERFRESPEVSNLLSRFLELVFT